MTDKSFQIHSLDEHGLNVLTDEGVQNPLTAKSVVLYPGDSLTITPEIIAANADRNGFSWLTMTESEQVARWGRARFGVGEVPQSLRDEVAAKRRAEAIRERDSLLRANPALRRASAAELRVTELNRLIDGAEQ